MAGASPLFLLGFCFAFVGFVYLTCFCAFGCGEILTFSTAKVGEKPENMTVFSTIVEF